MTALLPKLVIKGAGMTDTMIAPRRRSRWGLYIAPVLLLIAAIAWSAFWFFAVSQVDVQADAWRAHEAKSGRIYDCAKRSVAGFPFRLEIACDSPSVTLASQTAQPTSQFKATLDQILVVAQIYDPRHVIAEFSGPAAITDQGGQSFAASWKLGRASVFGLPDIPTRASVVFDEPALARLDGSVQVPLAQAGHVELHGRLAEGSPKDAPVIESVLEI